MTHRLRTYLTLTGVIIGISAIVFLVSLSLGLEKLVSKEITGGNAFQLIDIGTGNSQIVKLNNESIQQIRSIQGIKNVEPSISIGGKGKKTDAEIDATIIGANGQYLDWSGINPSWGKISDEPGVAVINTAYAKFLGEKDPSKYLGQKITLDILIPKEYSGEAENKRAENQEFTITGIVKDEANVKVYTGYHNLTKLGVKNYSQLKAELNNPNDASYVRKAIENMGYRTQYIGDTVAQIQQIFNIFKIILASFGLVALIVAGLGLFNTLTISLMERIKEVALMKILGMKKEDINRMFMTEAVIFGIFGGLAGIIVGIIFGLIANGILNHFALRAGGEAVAIFYFSPLFLIGMLLFSTFVGFLTGFYPAKRAVKVDALDVLRYE